MPLSRPSVERCQRENTTYRYTFPTGQLRTLRRLAARFGHDPRRVAQGATSRFTPGDWVRVRPAAEIRRLLDAQGRTRGLTWLPLMWDSCEGVYEVDSVVRRLLDDDGRMRRVGRTVTLHGLFCDGPDRHGGCGRSCPLLFRDEWLEPAGAPQERPPEDEARGYARVRQLGEILPGLDAAGRRDGVLFAPEMRALAGQRFPIHKRVEALAATSWRRPDGEWFVLDDLRCRGAALGEIGPCHRGCRLIWHRDWLVIEEPRP